MLVLGGLERRGEDEIVETRAEFVRDRPPGASARRRGPGCRGRGRSARRPAGGGPGCGPHGPSKGRDPGARRRSGRCRAARTSGPSTSTAISRRSVPTPGSTTARWTVPDREVVGDARQHERPLGDVLGGDRVADVDELRPGREARGPPPSSRPRKGRPARNRWSGSGFRRTRSRLLPLGFNVDWSGRRMDNIASNRER